MLEELGQPYVMQDDRPGSEAVRALSPLGKVPILIDGQAVLTDSVAILTYLADKHGALTYPAGTVERARQDGWTNFILDEMDSLLWTAARHSFVLPEDQRLPGIKDSLKWEFARSLTRFEALYQGGPFLMGEALTVPDILAAHCGGWAVSARFPVASEVFRDYVDRMRARPAFARAQAAG
jgi:glutathione S-transferase